MSTTDEQAESLEQQRRIAQTVGLSATRRHIFLCCDQTKPHCCDKQRSLEYVIERHPL